MQEMQVWSLGWEDPLEKEMATHFQPYRVFPGGPVAENQPVNQGTQVQSLVREIKSHILWDN